MTDRTVTLTIEPDVRRLHAAFARASGQQHLADVIMEQPGRQIVRDGMGDVLHWVRECACYHQEVPERCAWWVRQREEAIAQAAAAVGATMDQLRETFRRVVEAVRPVAEQLTEQYEAAQRALAPLAHPTGRAAQRSPYGPQGRR